MNMNNPTNWSNRTFLVHHLGRELAKGRLALLLGAGVSTAFNLPDWRALVDRLLIANGEDPTKDGEDVITKVGGLRARKYKDSSIRFVSDVQKALYKGASLDIEYLRRLDSLSAIATLIMAARRGSISKVITLNYDDLLEIYLEYHGLITDSVHNPRHWASSADAVIYHPHGFLPFTQGRKSSEDIVFGTNEYLRMLASGRENPWRAILDVVLRTHTVIQIGLSGSDIHLQALLEDLPRTHAYETVRSAYCGVRIVKSSTDNPDVASMMENWGIYTAEVASYDDIPKLLFSVCQAAREYRVNQDY